MTDFPNPVNVISKNKQVFNSFTEFNAIKKKLPVNFGVPFFSNTIEKSNMFLNHLVIVRHFVHIHPDFKSPLNLTKEATPVYGLDSLEGNKNKLIIIGILLINEEGKLQIEDEFTKITLDISQCKWDKAYFTQGSVVLTEGTYSSKIFKASFILQPPKVS